MYAQNEKRCTYADYLSWDDDKRRELIYGVPYMMAPAPTPAHQEVSVAIASQLYNFLKGKTCKVYSAPFDVKLSEDTVVQPDITVVCDPRKINSRGCNGAPDMVVEILSPSTALRDRVTKLQLYQSAGVREYWIVDPDAKTAHTHVLENGRYYVTSFEGASSVPVYVLDHCKINLFTN